LLYALLCFSMVAGLAVIVAFVEGDPINDLFLVPVLYSFMCGLSFFRARFVWALPGEKTVEHTGREYTSPGHVGSAVQEQRLPEYGAPLPVRGRYNFHVLFNTKRHRHIFDYSDVDSCA